MTAIDLAEQISACLRAADYAGLGDLSRPDVLLDVNLPRWRFQLQGPRALVGFFREEAEALPAGRLTVFRTTPTVDGVVVETEIRSSAGHDEQLRRDVHILHTDGEGITEHVLYSTGIWDAAAIASQQAEAPMVRQAVR